MGTVSLWTYFVILFCFGRIAFGQRCSYENPSREYRNVPSKLNLRNFLGSKLVQRLADNYPCNRPQYESYEPQQSNHFSYEQQMVRPPLPLHQSLPPQPLPPPPLPPSFSRGVNSYEYQNQRIPVQALAPPSLPQGIGASQGFGAPNNELSLPPRHAMGSVPPHLMGPPPPHAVGSPSTHVMELPPRGISPPPQQMASSNVHENYYTETVTSSCPGPSCGSCSECEAADQDYSFQDEPCTCCSEGNCPCACEECPCCCKEGGCCSGGRCPGFSNGDTSYHSEKEYQDRDPSYDEYPASDCPCACSGNQECPCAFSDEPQSPPHHIRERLPNYRPYPPANAMNENYMENPSDPPIQHHSERYAGMMGPAAYKPVPSTREFLPPNYSQYEEPMEPPPYIKVPPRRTYVPQPMPQPDIPQPVNPLPEEPMHHHLPHHHHHHHQIAETHERVIQHPHLPDVPERTMHHTEITEQTVHRYPVSPMQVQPVEPYSVHQDMPRVSEWRPVPRMPPPGPPKHIMEEVNPPVPIYRRYQPLPNRYGRKQRQPSKPPFFEGLNYSDGC